MFKMLPFITGAPLRYIPQGPLALAIIPAAIALAGTVASAALAPKPPKPPALPASKTDEQLTSEVRANEAERKRATAARKGQGSTILTSPLGLDESDDGITTNTLLGG